MFYQKICLLLLSVSLCMASENTKPESPLTKDELVEIIEQIKKDPNVWSELKHIKFYDQQLLVTIRLPDDIPHQINYSDEFVYGGIPVEIDRQEAYFKNILNCINKGDPICIEAASALQDNWNRDHDKIFWEKYEKKFKSLLIKNVQEANYYNKWLKAQKETVKNNQLNEFKLVVKKLLAYIQVKRLEK